MPDRMNELCLANLSVADAGPLGLLAAAAEAGFDSVNMWLVPPPAMAAFTLKCGATVPVVGNAALVREINQRIAVSGVEVFEASCGWLAPDFEAASIEPVLDTMAQLGTHRVSIVGWDADRTRFVTNLAALCARAAAYKITVTLEFMPYSAVRTVADAAGVLAAVDAANLDVLVDALHLARSGGSPADVHVLKPHQIGVLQLCDAPAAGPATAQLRDESVNRRLYPGDGELPLDDLLAAVPADIVIEIEIPSAEDAGASIVRRAQLCAERSRSFLAGYKARRLTAG